MYPQVVTMASDGKQESSDERGSNPPDFSDQEQELARNALIEFESARYDASLSCLSTLEGLRPNDAKVAHNKAVTEFYKSGCERTDDLLKSLNSVKRKVYYRVISVQIFTFLLKV